MAAKRKGPGVVQDTGAQQHPKESDPETPAQVPNATAGANSVGLPDRPVAPAVAALELVAQGWAVLPLRGKTPALPGHGFKDATTDPAQIARWWPAGSRRNIGAVPPAGTYVLDIDVYRDPAKLQPLADRLSALHTPMQRSGGGGLHFLLRGKPPRASELRRRWGVAKGIDVKAHGGGYIAVSPSVHPETGAYYEWANPPTIRPADAPEWLTSSNADVPRKDDGDSEPWAHRANKPIDEVKAALSTLDADCPRDVWVKRGQALKLEFGEDGWPVWHDWSATAVLKYADEDDCRRVWDSFGNNERATDTPATVRSILYDARATAPTPQAPAPAPASGALRLYNPLSDKPKRIDYMLHEPVWLPDVSEQVIFFGQSESFKSVAVEGLAVYLAAGVSLDGKVATEPRVVVYAAEEAPTLFDNNLHAWAMHFSKTLAPDIRQHAIDNLSAGYLKRIDGNIEGLNDKRAREIADLVLAQQKLLISNTRPVVVLDPVAEILSGNESSFEDMRKYIAAGRRVQRETGALVAHVHHTGHSETGRERGSSTLPAAMFARYKVERRGSDTYAFELHCTKHKARQKPRPSRWNVTPTELMQAVGEPNAEPITGVVIEFAGDATPMPTRADVEAETERSELHQLLSSYYSDPTVGKPRLQELLGWGGSKVDKIRDRAMARGFLQKSTGPGRAGYVITTDGIAFVADAEEADD